MQRKKTIIAAALGLALAAGGGGVWAYQAAQPKGIPLAATDVVTVAATELVTSVTSTGTIAPEREVSLHTRLTGPVAGLDAKVGDRVQARQLLATIDTTAQERELLSQRASQAAEQQNGLNQAEAAQLQLSQLQDSIAQGLHPEISAAAGSVRSAQASFDAAQKTAADKLADAAPEAASDPAVRDSAAAVQAAREQLRTARNNSLQAGLTSLGTTAEGETAGHTMASALLNWAEADASVTDAQGVLKRAEDNHAHAIAAAAKAHQRETTDAQRAAAEAQRAADAAYGELANAQAAARAAELSAGHQVAQQSQAVDHALQSAAGASVAADAANAPLEFDLASAEVRTPIAGLVTAVHATQGRPAEGPLLTVADDTTLLLKTTLKEADLPKVEVGDRVTFTSPSQPGATFTGAVSFISPVALGSGDAAASGAGAAPDSAGAAGAAAPAAGAKAEFPIEIRVDGKRDGLRLGSSAKLKIITDTQKDALTVPLSAVYKDNGADHVLVVRDGTITAQPVTLGTTSDFDAAIAEGLKPGDRVLTQADLHRDKVGQAAVVEGDDSESTADDHADGADAVANKEAGQ